MPTIRNNTFVNVLFCVPSSFQFKKSMQSQPDSCGSYVKTERRKAPCAYCIKRNTWTLVLVLKIDFKKLRPPPPEQYGIFTQQCNCGGDSGGNEGPATKPAVCESYLEEPVRPALLNHWPVSVQVKKDGKWQNTLHKTSESSLEKAQER